MLDRIQWTERHIVHTAGTTHDHGDYIVSRSSKYPRWYQANMIELRVSHGRTLSDWESVFHDHFCRNTYQHLMLYIPLVTGFEALLHEIDKTTGSQDAGSSPLIVQRITWMFATKPSPHMIPQDGMEIREIASDEDYQDLINFGVEEAREEPWFTNEKDARIFLESRREITDRIGVRWYCLCKRGSRCILARLGIFEHGGICRLQSVGTLKSYRRRGFGSTIVSYAIGEAVRRGAAGLALSTETGAGSHTMYSKAGFKSVGSDIWAIRYPNS